MVPTLENKLPEANHRTLTRRAARSQAVIGIARATLPGQMVLRLRRSAERMADLVEDVTAPAPDRSDDPEGKWLTNSEIKDVIQLRGFGELIHCRNCRNNRFLGCKRPFRSWTYPLRLPS